MRTARQKSVHGTQFAIDSVCRAFMSTEWAVMHQVRRRGAKGREMTKRKELSIFRIETHGRLSARRQILFKYLQAKRSVYSYVQRTAYTRNERQLCFFGLSLEWKINSAHCSNKENHKSIGADVVFGAILHFTARGISMQHQHLSITIQYSPIASTLTR